MKTLLWLDDLRDPFTPYWRDMFINPIVGRDNYDEIVWVRDYDAFVDHINRYGAPTIVCFDHDLGGFRTGYDAVKFLVYWCDTHRFDIPTYYIQSNNPVGSENIRSYIESYKRSLQ